MIAINKRASSQANHAGVQGQKELGNGEIAHRLSGITRVQGIKTFLNDSPTQIMHLCVHPIHLHPRDAALVNKEVAAAPATRPINTAKFNAYADGLKEVLADAKIQKRTIFVFESPEIRRAFGEWLKAERVKVLQPLTVIYSGDGGLLNKTLGPKSNPGVLSLKKRLEDSKLGVIFATGMFLGAGCLTDAIADIHLLAKMLRGKKAKPLQIAVNDKLALAANDFEK